MKKLLFLVLMGFASICRADSTTNRLGMTLPTIGSPTWGQKVNGNFQILDATAAALGWNNPWTSTNTFNGYVQFSSTVNWQNVNQGTGQFLGVNSSSNTVFLNSIPAAQLAGTVPNASIDSSSVTKQGNTFNTGSRLVQLVGGLVPNSLIDGSSVTKQGVLSAASPLTLISGSFGVNPSSVTLQGNTFNTGSKLLQLSGGLVPNSLIDGSSVTKQGVLVAGSNVTLTPGAGTLTIASTGGGGGITSISTMTAGATNFIFNTATLQSGATFYVSSGTVAGQLTASTFLYRGATDQGNGVAGPINLKLPLNGSTAANFDINGLVNPTGGDLNWRQCVFGICSNLMQMTIGASLSGTRSSLFIKDSGGNSTAEFSDARMSIPSALGLNISTFAYTSNITLDQGGAELSMLFDASAGSITVSLPQLSVFAIPRNYNRVYVFQKIDSSTNPVVAVSDPGNGSLEIGRLRFKNQSITVQADADNGYYSSWHVISEYNPNQIWNTGTLQSGATFYVSSGTVNGVLSVVSSGASVVPSVVQAAPSQSANLTEWKNSGGVVAAAMGLSSIGGNGAFLTLGAGGDSSQVVLNYGPGSGGDFTGALNGTQQMSFGFNNTGAYGGTGRMIYFYDRVGASNYGGINSLGEFTWGVSSTNYSVKLAYPYATNVPLTVRGAASQSTYLTEWQDSGGTPLTSIDPTGAIDVERSGGARVLIGYAGGSGYAPALSFGPSADTVLWATTAGTLQVNSAGSSPTKFVVRAGSSQGSTNLQEWQDSSGVAVSSVTSAGVITGPIRLIGHTIAWLHANAPLSASKGEQYYCDDCTVTAVAISTGSTAGSWGIPSSKTTFPN